MARLTSTQQDFIRVLFGPVATGNLQIAAQELGIDDYTPLMTEDLLEAIKKRADQELVMNVPKAIHMLNKILNNPDSVPYMDKLHKVAADVLDRAGLSKQDRPNSGGATIGLVFLPDKKSLPEPPHEEDDSQLQIEQ